MFGAAPAVDVTETDKGYDITAELPGMGEKNIEVTVADGVLTIKGGKQDEKEEKRRITIYANAVLVHRARVSGARWSRYRQDRSYVLTVTLPKSAEAQKAERKIPVKSA